MNNLSGAPLLGGKKPTTFNFDPPVPGEEPILSDEGLSKAKLSTSRASSADKKKKKDKKEKKKKKGEESSGSGTGGGKSVGFTSGSSSAHKVDDDDRFGDYSDDFVEEETLAATKHPVASSSSVGSMSLADLEREKERIRRETEDAHKAEIAKIRADQDAKLAEMNARIVQEEQRQKAREEELNKLRSAAEKAVDPDVINQHVQRALAAQQRKEEDSSKKQKKTRRDNNDDNDDDDEDAESDENEVPPGEDDRTQKEQQRRRRRERERMRDMRRLHEEEAAHSLFQRLAKDVREVFHELNMSVVAAEKERLMKDDRYRKEREMKDRREELERSEREGKDKRLREEKEEKFWKTLEERDTKFHDYMEHKLAREEAEREDKLKRDLEDRGERVRSEREMRDELERIERDRREREDLNSRDRDRVLLSSQLEEVKKQYRLQMDEMRRQAELDREHAQELHKLEIGAMEKRHVEAACLTEKHHREQVQLMDLHSGNATKLEQLIAKAHDEMVATQKMNEQALDERNAVMKQREVQLADQERLIGTVSKEMMSMKDSLDKERQRLASLFAQFELCVASFSKEGEEDRRKFRELHSHYETLRGQVEKDRRNMSQEIASERKLLEQQHDEFLDRKMQSLGELQAERMTIMKERTEAAMIKERQNRDETVLLQNVRSKEEELSHRLEAIENDRETASEMRREAARLRDEVAQEREAVRRERTMFEQEKDDLLERMQDLKRQSDQAVEDKANIRKELAFEKVERLNIEKSHRPHTSSHHGGRSPPHPSQLHIELAKQRAVLNRLSDNQKVATSVRLAPF